jgi:hypothetical protein
MPNRDAAALLLDHTHCRAICDEIGDRLRDVLKRETSEVPLRLRALIDKLAQLEIDDPVQLHGGPSIVPSIEETSFPRGRENRFVIKQSTDPALPATNRGLVFAGSWAERTAESSPSNLPTAIAPSSASPALIDDFRS